ncbi:unnamed protein product [Mytilus edulis]|uniref:Reverse transcriptase domain-containing protein n=1 Tax=Mytilus edulis TaxID=6550 RepID=A0A8S3QW36_MYTED|nr:unnamed protein product [Mytilus edulis]
MDSLQKFFDMALVEECTNGPNHTCTIEESRVLIDGQCGQKVLLEKGSNKERFIPKLYSILLNNLVPELPKSVQLALYADDLVLLGSEEEKTSGTLHTLSQNPIYQTPLKLEDQQIYLGVTFDKRLTWKQHEESCRNKMDVNKKNLEICIPRKCAMMSTQINSMEDITNRLPLRKRRECKAMIQATKYQCSQNHPINTRLKQLSLGRLKRSGFTLETRALQSSNQEVLP